ncbi:hypothetical protein NQ666_19085 [Acinetobacter baumannii]|uniref:hypothetical protein n=1 Tax=Acinetobacter baumannii TaxID=470 RepID=UPI00044F0B3A|nr:hypothetical protein [Acinetobacter baumannii]EXG91463.1 putative membrane protein [Acinetobacter baumannii 1062314]MDC4272220.1 hypothetical protein [Acinetobacter baumannii]MDC4456007.1 hypothetical protein [Acinetobacter baumannii]SSS76925.1 Uncharacterised protein [Acinetobacter baumannii]
MNVNKLLGNVSLFLVISVAVASATSKVPNPSFLNTIYTVSGIMFSIGMGVLCTLNPDKVKNDSIYKAIKSNILDVRNSYLAYFFIISFIYLIYQIYPDLNYVKIIWKIKITLDLACATLFLNILGILYFISNFIQIQKLGMDISDRVRESD